MDLDARIGRRIKLRDLHILLAVSHAGSMGRAAADLAVSQPVVSKAVAELEAALGARLFDRHAQGVVLTAYGEAMVRCGRAVFDELRGGVNVIDAMADPGSGELRIGCTEHAATGLVPRVIDRLATRHPKAVFELITADPARLAGEELPHRRVELAVGAVPEHLGHDIELLPLFEDRWVVMAGVDSPWAARRRLALSELREEPWILPPVESPARRGLDAWLAANGLPLPRLQVATFSLPLIHQLLATGRYLAVLPRESVRLAAHLPVRPLRLDCAGMARPIGIMSLRRRTKSALAMAFIDAGKARTPPQAGAVRGRGAAPAAGGAGRGSEPADL